jgi:serine protease
MFRTRAATIVGATVAALLVAGRAGGTVPPPPSPAGDAEGQPFVADEVVVGLRDGGERVVRLPEGIGPGRAAADLADRPEVRYANPNWIATAAIDPLDRGRSGEPRGWRADQWNFLGEPGGVRAPRAWGRLGREGAPGAAAVTVAVVDTGIAYRGPSPFARSPDFNWQQFVPGRDFVSGGAPLDENGHGTHIAGTIAAGVTLREPAPESVPDLTGLAYGAKLMPVRVLDREGTGTAAAVARGIRWAARQGADVINLSLQLPDRVQGCEQARAVCRAARSARRMGALVVAAAGNIDAGARRRVLFPAAAPGVIAVGASTEHGCLATYSHHGRRLDLLGPGGGRPYPRAARPTCAGDREQIRQVSFDCFPTGPCRTFDRFAIRSNTGTSMAAAHVSGVAALLRATGTVGPDPAPWRVRNRLLCSARPLGKPRFHGAGLVDATRATDLPTPARCRS